MKTIQLSGILSKHDLLHNYDLNGSHFFVDTNSDLGYITKHKQEKDKEVSETYLKLSDEVLSTKISDFNHCGKLIYAMYKCEVRWNKWLLSKYPTIETYDTPTLNALVYEQTQFPHKSIRACNLLTPVEDYLDKLGDRYTNIVIAVPKYKTFDDDILDYCREKTGTIPYSYRNILAFIKYLKAKKWEGTTDDKKLTCSETEAKSVFDLCSQLYKQIQICNASDVENLEHYKELIEWSREYWKIAPVHFLLLGKHYDFYLVK